MQVWDGENGVLLVDFHRHTASINALEVAPDEMRIFASGSDSRVISIARLNSSCSEVDRWVQTSTARPHTHDVTTLAICIRREGPCMLSGSLDTKMCCFYADARFDSTKPSWLLATPTEDIMSTNSKANLFAIQHRDYVDIWMTQTSSRNFVEDHFDADRSPLEVSRKKKRIFEELQSSVDYCSNPAVLRTRITIKGPNFISSMKISPDGSVIAIGSRDGVRMFQLNDNTSLKFPQLNTSFVNRLCSPFLASISCRYIAFSPDSRAIAIIFDSSSVVIGSFMGHNSPEECFSVTHEFNLSVVGNTIEYSNTEIENNISFVSLSFSPDGRWLGLASFDNKVHIYSLDQSRFYWHLPSFDAPIMNVKFSPQGALAVVLADNSIYFFDVLGKELLILPMEFSQNLERKVKTISHPLYGLSFCETSSFDRDAFQFVLYGQSTVLVGNFKGKEFTDTAPSLTLTTRYRNIAQVLMPSEVDLVSFSLLSFYFILQNWGPLGFLKRKNVFETKLSPYSNLTCIRISRV